MANDDAKGWQAAIVEDLDLATRFVVTFCPSCAGREFPDEDGVSHAEA